MVICKHVPIHRGTIYMADRKAALPELLAAQKQGMVICNRYCGSNEAFQSAKLPEKEQERWVEEYCQRMEHEIMGIPRADLNILLNVPYEITQELHKKKEERTYIKGKLQDQHERDEQYQRKVHQRYLDMAQKKTDWKRVDCAPR